MKTLEDLSESELSSLTSELDDRPSKKSRKSGIARTKNIPKPDSKEVKAVSKGNKRKLEIHPDGATKASKRVRTQQASSSATQVKTEEVKEEIGDTSFKERGRKPRTLKAETIIEDKTELASADEVETDIVRTEKGGHKRAKAKAKAKESETKEQVDTDEDGAVPKKPKRKRKTKEEKEASEIPIAPRTLGHKMFVGAHVSGAGGVNNSVTRSAYIGGNAFALFLKSQRKWENPPLKDEHLDGFLSNCKEHSYDQAQHILPHGSYLVNLAHADATRASQAYNSFLDDLQRCEKLGIKLYNFHPGNTNGLPRSEAIARLATHLNNAHKATPSVITVLETMAAGGNVIGSTFEDLRDTIALISDKSRVGVCLDTAHVFAAGYDLRTPAVFNETLSKFDEIIGMKYLKALHLNDSKAPFNSGRDLHFNIGLGFLGLRAFHSVMNEPRFYGLPLILETPSTSLDVDGNVVDGEKGTLAAGVLNYAQEIKLLESLTELDAEGEKFRALEAKLQKAGEKERKRVQEQVDRTEKKKQGKTKKGKKGKKEKDVDSESEPMLSES
ncbi:AP endonuclease [Viridothelium virens]|uniref:Apurinic-apyrimidinic endonuclease 1 n=1 Tax=Viridothelium virens TaxID=1048519 RepID=A0A6A6GYJ1_VIRVR|nr:AP endonuclease [Viridothelium virens]